VVWGKERFLRLSHDEGDWAKTPIGPAAAESSIPAIARHAHRVIIDGASEFEFMIALSPATAILFEYRISNIEFRAAEKNGITQVSAI
jgi:hypothetical protein